MGLWKANQDIWSLSIYALIVTEGCQPSEEVNGARGNDRCSDTGARDCDRFKEFVVICHSLPWDGLPFPSGPSSAIGSAAIFIIDMQITLASPIRLSAQRTLVMIGKL